MLWLFCLYKQKSHSLSTDVRRVHDSGLTRGWQQNCYKLQLQLNFELSLQTSLLYSPLSFRLIPKRSAIR